MKRKPFWLFPLFAFSLSTLPGCGSDDADADSKGGGACTVEDLGDGTSAIVCPDGTRLVVSHGKDGADGDKGDKGDKGDAADCTLGKSEDGKDTLTCGGQTVTIGDPCEDGYYGDVYLWNRDNTGSKAFTLFQVTNCTWIRGDLEIWGFDGETLPKALSRLEKVDGDIYVQYNDELTTVAFPALTTVGGSLEIDYNDALIDLDGFPALESVGGWLSIYENASLERVGNFQALKSVGGIKLWDNDALESIADFPTLEEIAGFGEGIGASYALVFIEDHPVLSSVGKLGQVTSIDGNVSVSYNPELLQSDIDALFEDIDISGWTKFCDNDGSGPC